MDIIKRSNRTKNIDEKRFLEVSQITTISKTLENLKNIEKKFTSIQKYESKNIYNSLLSQYPDDYSSEEFWEEGSNQNFKEFFVWGHNQDFGNGYYRNGAMGNRHFEIIATGLELGFIPKILDGKAVLNVGCWTGGDSLLLSGLGGNVTNLEEHPIASKAATDMFQLMKINSLVLPNSAFEDQPDWRHKYDFIYCSGVIYHVTDPILLLRILFCYLKPGGQIFLETKGYETSASCFSYSGSLEKGWNWFAPSERAMGRLLADVGFSLETIKIYTRKNKRILAKAVKTKPKKLSENAGFSRPGSWLEEIH